MEIKLKKQNSNLTVYVYGELDECSASTAKALLDKVLLSNLTADSVIFDLSGLSFMDSTGIGVLLGRYKLIKSRNKDIFISNASPVIEKIINMSGIYEIMPKIS